MMAAPGRPKSLQRLCFDALPSDVQSWQKLVDDGKWWAMRRYHQTITMVTDNKLSWPPILHWFHWLVHAVVKFQQDPFWVTQLVTMWPEACKYMCASTNCRCAKSKRASCNGCCMFLVANGLVRRCLMMKNKPPLLLQLSVKYRTVISLYPQSPSQSTIGLDQSPVLTVFSKHCRPLISHANPFPATPMRKNHDLPVIDHQENHAFTVISPSLTIN